MHEIGLCQSVLSVVEERAAGRPVARVRLRVGALHRVSPEAFDMNFALVAAGSVADGAAVDVVIVPATGSCRACGGEWEAEDQLPLCPHCGSMEVVIAGGDELVLESFALRA